MPQSSQSSTPAPRPSVTRLPRSSRSSTSALRPSVTRLLDKLRKGDVIGLGSLPKWPAEGKESVPHGCTVYEAECIVRAALSPRGALLIHLGGTMLDSQSPAAQTTMLHTIANALPNSRALCLNIGEWNLASHESYRHLVQALRRSNVGHLYWDRPGPANDLIKTATMILQRNRRRYRYVSYSRDPRVARFMRVGCHAWWNPSEQYPQRMKNTWHRYHSATNKRSRHYTENQSMWTELPPQYRQLATPHVQS